MSLPQEIRLDADALLWIGLAVHLSYALVTHFHWLSQLRNYEESSGTEIPAWNFICITIGRFLLAFPAKIVESILVLIIRSLGYALAWRKVEPWEYRWHVTPQWSINADFSDFGAAEP